MKRFFIIFFSLLASTSSSFGQSFLKNIGNPAIDDGATCMTMAQDQVFVAGYSGKECYIAMLELNGELIWKKYFTFSEHRNFISDMLVEEDHLVFCGYGHNAGTDVFDEFFVRYDYVNHQVDWARKTALNIKPNNIHPYDDGYIVTGDEYAKGKFGLSFFKLQSKNGRVNDFTTWYYMGHESASHSAIIDDIIYVGGRYGLKPRTDKYRASLSQFKTSDFSQIQSNYFLNSKQDEARAYLSDFFLRDDTIIAACYSNNKGIDNQYSLSLISTLLDGTVNWSYEYRLPNFSSLTSRDILPVEDGFYVFGITKSPEEQILLAKFGFDGYLKNAQLFGAGYNDNVFMDQGSFIAAHKGSIYLAAQTKNLSAMGDYDSFLMRLKEGETSDNACSLITAVALDMYGYEEFIEGTLNLLEYDTSFKEMNIAYEQLSSKLEIDDYICQQNILEEEEKQAISFENIAFNNTVFLMDASLSMNRPDRMPILKKSLYRLLKFMRSEDKISAIQFADKAEVIADAISAANMDEIKLKIDKLSSTGQSDIIAGLQLGYELAKKHFSPEANNRIIITTDGDLSFDTQDKLRTFLKKKHDENIVFTILLFNNSSIYYQQLQQIANEVDSQIFVVNPENIEEILLNEFRAKKQ